MILHFCCLFFFVVDCRLLQEENISVFRCRSWWDQQLERFPFSFPMQYNVYNNVQNWRIIQSVSQLPHLYLYHETIRFILLFVALNTVGLLRHSGNVALIERWKSAYDRGDKVDLTLEEDPHIVAGILRAFLRELPEPLVGYSNYKRVVDIASTHSHRLTHSLSLIFVRVWYCILHKLMLNFVFFCWLNNKRGIRSITSNFRFETTRRKSSTRERITSPRTHEILQTNRLSICSKQNGIFQNAFKNFILFSFVVIHFFVCCEDCKKHCHCDGSSHLSKWSGTTWLTSIIRWKRCR